MCVSITIMISSSFIIMFIIIATIIIIIIITIITIIIIITSLTGFRTGSGQTESSRKGHESPT